MIVDPATAPMDVGDNGARIVYLSNAGRLTQFGAYLDTLAPGASSSQRHWHSAEDEFLLMLDGTATVVDDDGAHRIGPGDGAAWRHGDPNAHHLHNRTDRPATYLIVGTRVAHDVCTYPDEGERQVNGDTTWAIVDATGTEVEGGDLPPHLLNLPPVWGTPFDPAQPAPRILRKDAVRTDRATPDQIAHLGDFRALLYSDTGGLSQFGAFVETLPPGSASSDRHWHENEDEFLYVLTGTPTVVEDDGPHRLGPGDCACWPAGVANGHHVVNRSDADCGYLVVGTRAASDRVHYSDIDKLYTRENGVARRTRRDGSPLT
jgi:uncharacterized cupin superfamily protein